MERHVSHVKTDFMTAVVIETAQSIVLLITVQTMETVMSAKRDTLARSVSRTVLLVVKPQHVTRQSDSVIMDVSLVTWEIVAAQKVRQEKVVENHVLVGIPVHCVLADVQSNVRRVYSPMPLRVRLVKQVSVFNKGI